MTAPSAKVRADTYKRDGHRCVSCMRTDRLQWNHRESSGHGGRGRKAPPLTSADGVTSCFDCNPRYESDMQGQALAFGWKLRRNRLMAARDIPFYDRGAGEWFLPRDGAVRESVIPAIAAELLAGAGNLPEGLAHEYLSLHGMLPEVLS